MNVKRLTDEQLVSAIHQQFNPQLFSELVNRYEKKVTGKCREYVKDEDVAKDLAQDIFLKLFLKLDSFKEQSRFSSWFFAIVHNTCMDYLRKSRKRYHAEITEELVDKVGEMSELEGEVPEAMSIEILEELLEQIPPEDKMILLLKYREKASIKDIQTALDIGESAVKMRLKRAREKITRIHREHQRKD